MTTTRKKTPPAKGEQKAISGYHFQYKTAAYLIIKYLKKRQLKWIKLIDPEAGKLDDLQLNISDTVYAYQMKWSQSSTYLSFNQITSSSDKNPSIINQLANGWKQLTKKHGDNVKVHFLTNMSPSKNDKPSKSNKNKSFKNFIDEQWNNRNYYTKNDVPDDWKEIWEKIICESGLHEEDFLKFIKSCEFIFSFKYPEEICPFPEDFQLLNTDINSLINLLIDLIAQTNSPPLKLTSEELLEKLGWSNRIKSKNIHNFPIDRKIYEPIERSEKELLEKVKNVESGYILLQGSPGSGKSSLLSTLLMDSDKLKVIKYFCYIPDDKSISISRGESVNFLHDVSQELELCGYQTGNSLSSFDLSFLHEKLQYQLQQVENKYQESQKKVIVIIDGLDHIQREMNPNISLLSDLPQPNSLPKGIVFLLSSQLDRLENLPSKIEEQVNEQNRKIIMNKLSKKAVLKIIDKSELKVNLNNNKKDLIVKKCEGHPLALKLILKKISRCTDNIQMDSTLQNIDNFDKSIEKAYYSHWKRINENTKLVRLLGLISRITDGIDWNWISQWEVQDTIDLFKKDFWYYFEEHNEKWYFFHNSFRVFIEYKTIEKPHGGYDWSKDKEFHKILAEKINNTPNKFEEIFHLYKAKEYQKIVDISNQEYFKHQIDNFLPPDVVLDNIRFAILASKHLKNINHIFNLTLSASMVNLIESYLFEDPVKLIKLLLSLGKFELAQAYIKKRRTLLISKKNAMNLVSSLLHHNLKTEAELLFELSEPIELLIGEQALTPNQQDEEVELLEEWATNAPIFYSVDKICSSILSIKIKENRYPKEIDNDFKARLFYKAGKTLIDENNLKDLENIFHHLQTLNQRGYYFGLLYYIWKTKRDAQVKKKYFNLATRLTVTNNNMALYLLAEGYCFILKNKNLAKIIIEKIEYPKKVVQIYNNFDDLIYRFKLIRLMTTLNIPFSLNELISDPKESRDWGLILLERNFGKLAILWGKYLSGKRMTSELLQNSILPLIQFYNKNYPANINWTSAYFIPKSQNEFFRQLISFIQSSYPYELTNILKLFRDQWYAENTKKYWNNDIKIKIISIFLDAGCSKSELNEELENLKINSPVKSMYEEISEQLDYAFLLRKFNQNEKAKEILKTLINNSISIGYRKDYQLVTWIDWLRAYNKKVSENKEQRIEKFIKYIQISDKIAEQYGRDVICRKLINAAADHSSFYAFELSKWLLNNNLISFYEQTDYLMSALIENHYITTDEGVVTLKNIILSISTYNECYTLESVVKSLKTSSKTKIKITVSQLIESINTLSLPSKRNALKRIIIDSLNEIDVNWMSLDIEWNDVKNTRSTSDVENFNVNNITSLSDIIQLKNSSPDFSGFNWSKLISQKKHLISSNDLPTIKEGFKEHYNWNEILHILSDYFYQKGEKDTSLQLAQEFFNNSRPYSWGTWWDDGTRIKALKTLKKHMQPEKFKETVIHTLADDLQQLSNVYLAIAQEFDEICKLIFDEVPIRSLWPIVDKFLEKLFSSYYKNNFPSIQITKPIEHNIPIIFQILLPLLSHNINIISQGAYSALYDLFHEMDNSSTISKIFNVTDDEQQVFLLNILKGIIFYNPDKKQIVPIKSLKLMQPNNFYVRMLTQDLLVKLDNKIPNYTGKTLQKHTLYELDFPEPQPTRLYGTENYDGYRILPDTHNPFENINLYKQYIDILSELSNISPIQLALRTSQIMDELTNKESYGAKAEQLLRSKLKSQKLQLIFRRPRYLVARRAICYLISELIDSKQLKEKEALLVMHHFSHIDPLLITVKWNQKPNFIQYNLPEKHTTHNWINQPISKSQLNIGQEFESMICVGELKETKSMIWSAPTEIMEQVLSLSRTFDSNQTIPCNDKFLYQDYPNITHPLDILCRNSIIEFDTEKSDWLAIHPSVMKQLGMYLSKDAPFTWLSSKGEIVAQTIFWRDGIIEHAHPSHNDHCGKGVFCLLDKNILDKILSENKVYLKVNRVRKYIQNKEPITKSTKLCKVYS